MTCATVAPPARNIGVTVSGLAGTTGLVLQNNGGDNLSVGANGTSTFAARVPNGGAYAVTVLTLPANPAQTCDVANGTGTATADVSNVTVSCTTTRFTVGGTVSGLAGTGLVLRNNGGNNLAVSANGNFTFTTPIEGGTSYAVTVFAQPTSPAQVCSVSANPTGTVSGNVTNVAVTCTTVPGFSISVTVSGLDGTGLVLRNNGGNDLAIASNGNATFTTTTQSGGAYNVTVLTQPTTRTQTCVVGNPTGTVTANVSLAVTCTTTPFTVGGTVSGLAGSGLVLLNSGGNNLARSADGNFTFTTPVLSGNTYNVTVLTQPTNPFQACTVANGSGNVGAANVVNVAVNCTNQSVRYAHVANSSDNSVWIYVVDAATGRLKFIDKVAAGLAPKSVTVDPSSRFAYVAGGGSSSGTGIVSQYTIGSNGTLTPMTTPTVPAGSGANSVSVDPSGRFAYVANYDGVPGTVSQYTIGAGGALTPIPGAATVTVTAGEYPFSVSVHPSGKFAYVVNNGTSASNGSIGQYAIGANGGLTPLGTATVPAGVNPSLFSVDPTGRFAYAANWNSANVSQYTIGADGLLTPMNPAAVAVGSTPNAVVIDPSAKSAYVSNWGNGNVSQFAIAANGNLTPISGAAATVAAGTYPVGVTVDPSGKFAYVANFYGNDLSQYTIGTDGSLTPNAAVTVAAPGNPASIAFSHGPTASVAVAKYAYVANAGGNNVSQYTVSSDGNLTPMTPPTVATGTSPFFMTVDPRGKFAYVPNRASNTVSQYAIGPNGSLLPMATAAVAAGTNPVFVTVDPSSKFAYVANFNSNNVSQYTIGADGSLAPMTAATVAAGIGPISVSVHPGGKFAFVANNDGNNVSQYTIDANGSLTAMTPATVLAGLNLEDVKVDPTGKFAYVANGDSNTVSQYTIENGSLTPMTPPTASTATDPVSIGIHPSGKFAYVANYGSNNITQYAIAGNGNLTSIASPVSTGTSPYTVTVDPSGKFVYVANYNSGTVSMFSINPNGTLSPLISSAPTGTVPAGTNPSSVTSVGTWQ